MKLSHDLIVDYIVTTRIYTELNEEIIHKIIKESKNFHNQCELRFRGRNFKHFMAYNTEFNIIYLGSQRSPSLGEWYKVDDEDDIEQVVL